MCGTSNQSEEPVRKRLSDSGEYDTTKVDGSGAVVEDVSDMVLSGRVTVASLAGMAPSVRILLNFALW